MGWFTSEVKAEDAVSPVPGTVHLVDLDGTIAAQHAEGSGKRDIVLVPAPSSDPDDPVCLPFCRQRRMSRSNCNAAAQLVTISQDAVCHVYVCLHAHGRNCLCCDLLGT